jgi:hypothetical protein
VLATVIDRLVHERCTIVVLCNAFRLSQLYLPEDKFLLEMVVKLGRNSFAFSLVRQELTRWPGYGAPFEI